METCNKEDRFKSIENTQEKHGNDIDKLKEEVSILKINDRGIEEVIKKLEENFEKIVKSIDKAKWWFLTGMLGPLILAFILSRLNL
ncbi:hypothetical protein [Senegalia massiliensis]|uniref:Uncharacterized protein n=1 Tax=Senegalia massiliensis TaxID=1720316 RepID=A0A845R329_9CLOT|nr:hypothetical protein [Senegalia massiliensis]NBI08369.1 hypothetical protein [Senegalia massiliensis]